MAVKKADRKEKRKARALEVQQKLKVAKQASDVLKDFPAFQKYDRLGITVCLEYFHADSLLPELKSEIFLLCKKNMEKQYATAWGWDDTAKTKELQSSDARFLVVFSLTGSTQEMIAFVHMRFENEEGTPVLYIYELQLRHDFQRKGLGKFLMQLAELIGWKWGMEALMLTVLEASQGAMQFYSHLGFTVDSSSPTEEDWKDGKPPGYLILSKPVKGRNHARPVLKDVNCGEISRVAAAV
eukprot:jgi/Botrbrau1/1138/Bobra.0162s0029.2